MRDFKLYILFSFIIICLIRNTQSKKSNLSKEDPKAVQLPQCAACKMFVNSFKNGIKKTSRSNFEGGDSAYEEAKLGKYANSETRLAEIQELLCKEVERGQNQCYTLMEEWDGLVEDWWFKHQDTDPDIYEYLCIKKTEKCCPKDHYGAKCIPCSGYPDNVCSNNGKCKGAGTRVGNGACVCDRGYDGETCFQCATGYYESYKDENKLLCSQCHSACKDSCKGPGPKDCEECDEGWQMIEEEGCFDINECLRSDEACPGNQFCVNKEGGYTCLGCDKACNGCSGDGPDMCITCASGYYKKDNLCISSDLLGQKKKENLARYATYLGLCVATCIILQKNVYAASIIGLSVGIYISLSEYMIANTNIQDSSANMDILGPLI